MQNLDMPQIFIKYKEGKRIIVLNFLIREKIDSSSLIEVCYCERVKVGRNDNGDVIVIFSKDVPVAFEIECFLPVKESKETLKIFQEVIDSIDHLSPMYKLSKNHLIS